MHLKILVPIVYSIIFTACDKDGLVTYYDKSLKGKKIDCLSYVPKNNSKLEKELASLYEFKSDCPYRLELSFKSNIVCNSPYNASAKATSAFPTAFITLEVKKGFSLEYSYYKDLNDKIDKDDLIEAFERVKSDILSTN